MDLKKCYLLEDLFPKSFADYEERSYGMLFYALQKCGCKPEETVFIDDSVRNLEGAETLGITPILIAANSVADVETKYYKIHSLSELLQ